MILHEKFITKSDLDQIEKYADKIFAKVGIDVEFTRHFLDRVNDERNKKQITSAELTRLFKQSYAKYGKKIAQLGPDAEPTKHTPVSYTHLTLPTNREV